MANHHCSQCGIELNHDRTVQNAASPGTPLRLCDDCHDVYNTDLLVMIVRHLEAIYLDVSQTAEIASDMWTEQHNG